MFDRIKQRRRARREARRQPTPSPAPGPGPITPAPAKRPGLLKRIMMNWIKSLLATAPNSIKGQIDLTELWKALATALGPSVLIGLAVAVLTAISTSLPAIIPNVLISAPLGYVLSLVIDLLRRQAAGVTPLQLASGTPVPVSGTFVPRPDLEIVRRDPDPFPR